MRFALWMLLGITSELNHFYLNTMLILKYSLCGFILGFSIYFGYGIRNSTEAALARSNTYTESCTINGEPMTTEKEAFLHGSTDGPGDNDEAS